MMEKTELIAEIIRLYDKVNELQTTIKTGEKACSEPQVGSAEDGMNMLKTRFFDAFFNYDEFKNTIVVSWSLPDPKRYSEYGNWLDDITWDKFRTRPSSFTLDEMKTMFAEHLRRYYDEHKKEEVEE